MALETGTYIDDLVAANPEPTDELNTIDDHARLIKSVLKASLPGLDGALLSAAGRVLAARLATGTANSRGFLRGNGVWNDGHNPFTSITRQASLTWNLSTHPNATIAMNGNVTSVTLSNGANGGVYTMVFTQDSTGGRTFAFPSAWQWAGGSAGSIASGANAKTVLTIKRVGTTIIAAPLLLDVS